MIGSTILHRGLCILGDLDRVINISISIISIAVIIVTVISGDRRYIP